MSAHRIPQQEAPDTIGHAAERFLTLGKLKQYPPLEAVALYVPRGRDCWMHWLTWRYQSASRGDRAAAAELARAVKLAAAYVEPEPDEDEPERRYVKAAS